MTGKKCFDLIIINIVRINGKIKKKITIKIHLVTILRNKNEYLKPIYQQTITFIINWISK